MSLLRLFSVAAIVLTASACSSNGLVTTEVDSAAIVPGVPQMAAGDEVEEGGDVEVSPVLVSAYSAEIEKVISETEGVFSGATQEKTEKHQIEVPKEFNSRVAFWIDYFTNRERDRTIQFLQRGEALRPHIQRILKENEMPPELYYLAMIESGFVHYAKSRAKAVGMWQFMKRTAKGYDLTVNEVQDERRHWVKATEAAASYLKDLNNVFGSWYLALAAYNAGEHRIVRSIMNGKTRDFWALAEGRMLPKETMNYVPKFLAALVVGRNLKKFNLEVQPEETWEEYELVAVPAGVPLKSVADTAQVSLEELKKWNQDLVRGLTPPDSSGKTEIYMPKGIAAKVEENKTAVFALKSSKADRALASVAVTHHGKKTKGQGGAEDVSTYVVKRGDTLSGISKRFRVSVRTLMKANGLKKSRIHAGQRLKFYTSGY